jgi:hypothetical protein
MADLLFGITKHWEAGGAHKTPHVTIVLLGRFKSEIGERYHLLPLAATTKSGLEIRKWVGRLILELHSKGISHGPLVRDALGQPMRAGGLEEDSLPA